MNHLAQENEENMNNQVLKTTELIEEQVQMQMEMRERDRVSKMNQTKTTSSDPFIDKSKSDMTPRDFSSRSLEPKSKDKTPQAQPKDQKQTQMASASKMDK